MSIAESRVKEIIKRPLDYDGWTIQGLGMLRLHLDDSNETRLHIWDTQTALNDQTSAHDHPWDIVNSTVYFGAMGNQRYGLSNEGDIPIQISRVLCGIGSDFEGESTTGFMFELGERELYEPGGSYSIDATEFHNSFPERGTVTVITRRFRPDLEQIVGRRVATICWTGDEDWERDGFNRVATKDEILHFTGLVALNS